MIANAAAVYAQKEAELWKATKRRRQEREREEGDRRHGGRAKGEENIDGLMERVACDAVGMNEKGNGRKEGRRIASRAEKRRSHQEGGRGDGVGPGWNAPESARNVRRRIVGMTMVAAEEWEEREREGEDERGMGMKGKTKRLVQQPGIKQSVSGGVKGSDISGAFARE